MSTLSDGFFISFVGLAAVFVILTLIMLVMLTISRLFRSDDAGVETAEQRAETRLSPEPTVSGAEPEGPCEVAAIGLALAHHLRRRGRPIGTSIAINQVSYQLQIGDMSCFPASILVNGGCYRGTIGEDALPYARPVPRGNEVRRTDRRRERNWRTPFQLPQGGCWQPAGWSVRHGRPGGRT